MKPWIKRTLFSLLVASILVGSLTACGSSATPAASSATPSAVT